MVYLGKFQTFSGILRELMFLWYFTEAVIFQCYRTNFPKQITNISQVNNEGPRVCVCVCRGVMILSVDSFEA